LTTTAENACYDERGGGWPGNQGKGRLTVGSSSSDKTVRIWECPHLHRSNRSDRIPGLGAETKTFPQFLQIVTMPKA
jgi:hypothetical protein